MSDYGAAFIALAEQLRKRNAQRGDRPFVNNEEFRGALDEECEELHEAIRSKDPAHIRAEAMDCAVVLLHWLATEGDRK